MSRPKKKFTTPSNQFDRYYEVSTEGKLRFASVSPETAVEQAQRIFRDEKIKPDIFEIVRVTP
jgi:hypothetical protein